MRPASTLLLLSLALAASATLFTHGLDARTAPSRVGTSAARDARPIVLVVHGRGHLTRDSAAFRGEVLRALREGAFRATGDSLFADGDVRLAWYADLLDVRQSGGDVQPCPGAETETQLDGSPASILRTLARVGSELLDAGASSMETVELRSIAGDLRFFGDVATRCAAERRVAEAIASANTEGRPVVLMAHSLGSLVTWSYLRHRGSEKGAEIRLVTVGSPVGLSGLRELLLGDESPLALPRGVLSWVNVVNESDPFASRLLANDSASGQVHGISGLSDVVTTLGDGDVHELRGYLRDSTTASAVVEAWCEGLNGRGGVCAALAKRRRINPASRSTSDADFGHPTSLPSDPSDPPTGWSARDSSSARARVDVEASRRAGQLARRSSRPLPS